MSTTSKPAVTPEMLEKVRALPCKCGPCIADFAASAVQDAVSEMEPHLDHLWYCHVHLSEENACNCGLAALREKYGVKP